jgi:hypothetical protein
MASESMVMPMKIEGPENIRDIFSIFHDGSITHSSLEADTLSFDVEIQYLAERVSRAFRKFHVRLLGVANIHFSTWPRDLKSEPAVLTDPQKIFEPDLEILEGSLNGKEVQVVCNQHASDFPYCGGELRLRGAAAEVTDEAGKSYSLDELTALCKGYWDDWAKRNQA